MGESLCSFLNRVVVGQVVTVNPEGRAVAARDGGCKGNPCRVRGGRKGSRHGGSNPPGSAAA